MGNAYSSPTARRQLGTLLRQLREQSGKTIQDVGEAKVAGATKVWKLETGKALPSIPDVVSLCWLYDVDQPMTQRLIDMVNDFSTGTNGWWENYGQGVSALLSLYVGMEQTAQQISIFQPEMVYGLLQTPAYALAANSPGVPAKTYTEARLARGRAVRERTDDYQIDVILGAGALLLQVGGPEILTEQIEYLLSLRGKYPIDIRVLGWEVGMHASTYGPYSIFGFTEPVEDVVVHVPALSGGRYFDKPQQVAPYEKAFATIWSLAVPIEEYVR